MECPSCHAPILDIDVKCAACGAALGSTGAHRLIGSVVLGQYELVDVLGQGGMSVVYKGRHKLTDQEVALKILPPELAAHSQVKSRFLDEAKALAQLDHNNIVHLYNFGQENGCFVLAMQYVPGRTWERMILESTKLDWQVSCRIAIDVLRALEYAHGRGVIHRDMKPSNVLVRDLDGAATVMDFGIAKMTTSTKLTATGQTMGTVRYMSPEQVRGQEVDLRTDLYSLGATLYESLVGDTPFDGSTHFEIMTKHLSEAPKRPSSIGIDVPSAVEDALMRSLAKRADDRQATAREFRKVLEAALRDGDLGLVETQRVNRDHVKTTRAATPPAASPLVGQSMAGAGGAAATAADLADELEPSSSREMPKRRLSNAFVFGAIGVVVVAGGVTAALVLTRGHHDAPPVADAAAVAAGPALLTLPGVQIAATATSSDLRVTIQAVAGITPKQIEDAYRVALGELREFAKGKKLAFAIVEPLDQILAVLPSALCEPTLYASADDDGLKKCARALSVVPLTRAHTLVVVADPSKLEAAMREGVATAACLNPEQPQQDALCEAIPKFIERKDH